MRAPERPRQVATGVVNVGIIPTFAVIETELDPRDPAVPAKGDAFYLDWSVELAQRKLSIVVGHVDARARWDNEIRAPALGFIESFRLATGHFDSRQPFHMFLAEISGHDHARGITMSMRQRLTVHFVGYERVWIHRFFEWKCIRVIIDAVQSNFRRI